jgi:hypothetical protein
LSKDLISASLKEIIWQARNQAFHWEDGSFHEPTTKCFEHLATNVDPVFAQFKDRSLAFEIIGLLGWNNAEAFFTDMKLLQRVVQHAAQPIIPPDLAHKAAQGQ